MSDHELDEFNALKVSVVAGLEFRSLLMDPEELRSALRVLRTSAALLRVHYVRAVGVFYAAVSLVIGFFLVLYVGMLSLIQRHVGDHDTLFFFVAMAAFWLLFWFFASHQRLNERLKAVEEERSYFRSRYRFHRDALAAVKRRERSRRSAKVGV